MKALPRALHGLRVLVVEDQADLCELFVLLLRTEGAEATKAQTGREAVDFGQTQRFDVVLCDLNLPDIPGEILIRHLLATVPRPPVIVGISSGGELQLRRAMAAGAKAVFRKPVEWERIVAFLRGLEGRSDVCDVAS
jgi:CheY-like chemotaxis protein